MPIYNNKEYIKLMRPIPDDWPLDIEGIPFVRKSIIDIKNLNNGKWMINISNAQENDKYAYNDSQAIGKFAGFGRFGLFAE